MTHESIRQFEKQVLANLSEKETQELGNVVAQLLKASSVETFDARLGVPDHLAGIFADDRLKAEGILEFACPTQGADGKWYRCTIALSNVPVSELYNVLSGINFVVQRLREIGGAAVLQQAIELERLHELLKARDQRRIGALELDGQNVHERRIG